MSVAFAQACTTDIERSGTAVGFYRGGMEPATRPLVIAVGGIPGSGKTTLSRRLGDALHLPVVGRDAIKEGMHVTHASDDPAEVRRFSVAAFDVFWSSVGMLVDAEVSLVAEAAFHRDHAERELRKLADRAAVVLVWCEVDPAVATDRYADRAARGERHPAHADERFAAEMRGSGFDWSDYEPPNGPWPIRRVDTTTPPAIEELVSWVRGALAAG